MSWLISRALLNAYENSPCSQAAEVESSVATSLDGAPSVPSNSTSTPPAYWSPGRTMESSRRSRSGRMTFGSLTESRGEDLLTWFREDFHAPISPCVEREPGSTARKADSGAKWQGSFARFDPSTSSLRTAQCSLLGEDHESSVILPRWGSMLRGECWERSTLAPGISESACGLLPTLLASTGGPEPDGKTGRKLTTVVARGLLPTLLASDGAKGGPNQRGSKGDLRLPSAVARLPTLAARDHRSPNKKTYKERGGGCKGEQLPNAIGGPLNPTWAEWHMGFPKGWSDLAPMDQQDFDEWERGAGRGQWAAEWEGVPRMAMGIPNRVARIMALGNAQVPAAAALAWRTLSERLMTD